MRGRTGGPGRPGTLEALLFLAVLLALTALLIPGRASAREVAGFVLQDPPPPLERVIGLELTEVTLGQALNRIQRATGVALVYSPDFVPVQRTVTCACSEKTVRQGLALLLRGTNLTFDAVGNQVRIAPIPRRSEEPTLGNIVGTVLNQENDLPIHNALIQLSDGRGSLSNEHGRFILMKVPPGTYTVSVSGLGWTSRVVEGVEVVAGGTANVQVRLTRRVIPLSAIIVSPGTFGLLDEASDFALQTLTREQIETIPQVGEDVFRSLRRLPGLASGDISTRLYLRGGLDREVLMLLDGMELYEPYHLKDFEGALGIIDINAVGGIDLHTGGFPVDYGNRMAGVFDMQTRSPPEEGTRTSLGLSITNASLLSQGTFGNGRGNWLLSARRGYMDIAFKLTDVDDDLKPRYYDALGKVEYQLGSRHLFSLHVLQAGDNLTLDPEVFGDDESTGELITEWGNTYGWLTWKAFISPRVRTRTILSGGRISRSRTGFSSEPGRVEGPEMADVSDKAEARFGGIKHEWTVDFSDNLVFRAGGSVERLFGEYDYRNWTRTLVATPSGDLTGVVDTTRVDLEPTGTAYGAFGAVRFKPAPWGTAEVGLRYDRRTYTDDSDISPRIHALIDLGERTTLRAGWGQYHQSQGIYELEAADGETSFTPSERTTQVALGVEHKPKEDVTLRAELYHRDVDRPRRFYWNRWREIQPFPEIDGDRYRIDPTDGRARGMELLAFKANGRWSWSASYALSAAEDRIQGEWVRRFWDQTHALALTLGWRPNERWTVTGAWQARSGWPYTPQIIEFDTLTVFRDDGSQWPLRWKEDFGPMNSIRLPTYHRLDLRVTRRFDVGKGFLDVYLDLFNAYDQQNLRSFDWGVRDINGALVYVRYPDEELLPILPSLGLRWEF
jgi:hypothetical protein